MRTTPYLQPNYVEVLVSLLKIKIVVNIYIYSSLSRNDCILHVEVNILYNRYLVPLKQKNKTQK